MKSIIRFAFFLFPFVAAAPAVAAERTEHVQETVAFPAGGTLKLKNWSGDIRITGADRPDVEIVAIRRAPRARLDRIALQIESTPSGVVIDANGRGSEREERNTIVHTEFAIRVPRAAHVDISSFSSAIQVDGVIGALKVHTYSGDIRIGVVHRALEARTFSGGVDATLSDLVGGSDVDVETYSGNIRIRMPRAVPASFSFTTYSGDIDSAYPVLLRSKSGRNLTGQLAPLAVESRARGRLRFETFSGHVRITR